MGDEPTCKDCKYYGVCDDTTKDTRLYPCADFDWRGSLYNSPRFYKPPVIETELSHDQQ